MEINKINENIKSIFSNPFSNSNIFNFDDKEDIKIDYSIEYSKQSTVSELTNDDSFEKEISDMGSMLKTNFIHRKRIRSKKK